MTAVCIHPRHGDDPPTTDVGYLCRGCHRRLTRDLADIVTTVCRKPDLIQPNRGTGGAAPGKPGSRSPARDDLIAALDIRSMPTADLVNVAAVVDSWCRVLVEERQLSRIPRDTVEAATLMGTHVDWLACQPFIDEMTTEIHDAAVQMRRIANDLPPTALGRCPSIDPYGEADRCNGPLRWVDGTLAVRCDRCLDTWRTEDLVYLGRVSPVNVWATVPQVAQMLDIPDRTVRHWVAVGRLRRDSFGQVCHADVWRIMNQRSDPQQRLTAEGPSTT